MREFISSIQDRTSHTTAAALRRFAVARSRDPIFWLIICGCVLVAAIAFGTIMMVGEFRERAIANSERELQNAVLLMTRHFDQQFEDTEVIAADVITQMKFPEIISPDDFVRKMSGPEAHATAEVEGQQAVLYGRGHDLRCRRQSDQLVRQLADVVSHSRRSRLFQALQDRSARATGSHRGGAQRVYGQWTTVIAHRLNGAGGVFLGVMARRIDPANYEKFFASVTLGPGSAISLFHGDGTMLARYPHVEELIGKKFRSAPLIERVLDKGGLQTLQVQQPGRSSGPARLRCDVAPLSDRGHRHQQRRFGACRLAGPDPLPDPRGSAVRVGDRPHPVPDRPPDQPAERGGPAAARRRKAPARHRAEQHVARPHTLRCIGADRDLQPALCRHVQTVDRRGEAGPALLRPDPASQGHRLL